MTPAEVVSVASALGIRLWTDRASILYESPGPLPANVRKGYDVLRFAYEWDFFDGSRRRTVSGSEPGAR